MKKVYLALMCLAVVAMFTACNEKKTNDPEDQTTQNDPSNPSDPSNPGGGGNDDPNMTNWEKCIKNVKPGIYQGKTDEELGLSNMGYDKVILAVCEDGSAFYVQNATSGEGVAAIAPFTVYDGKLTFYNVKAEKESGEYHYDRQIITCSKDPLTTLGNVTYDIKQQLKLFATKFGFDDYIYKGTMIEKYFRRIDDAKDMTTTFQKVFNLVKHDGDFVALNNFFTYDHTIYGDGWHNELYPSSSMNAARWVVPYEGNGTIERFTVRRQRNWGYDAKWYLFYGPCNYELVTYVECDVACDKDAAVAEYNLIKGMNDRYTDVINDAVNDYFVWFEADSDDDDLDLSGYSGYIRPTYKVQRNAPVGSVNYPMTIIFGVAWITFV